MKPRAISLLLISCICWAHAHAEERFERDVLPVFKTRCLSCHSGKTPQAGLDLATAPALLKGGRSGPSIVIGEAARSLLIEKVVSKSMPPSDPKLTEQEIHAIRS